MIRQVVLSAALLVAGCAPSGPAGPTLPVPLTFSMADYEDKGGILPITGTLVLTIEPSGVAKSACHRPILTDVERRGELNGEQLQELVRRVDAWAAKAGDAPPAPAKVYATLVYGTKKAWWQKDATLDPELTSLVQFLLSIPPSLSVIRSH